MGADALLLDEDTCATNALIRDEKMIQLVALGKDPITPFVNIVRNLYKQMSVSTILVMGGSGDYFSVADHVLVMDSYHCQDATSRAKEIADRHGHSSCGQSTPISPLAMVSAHPRQITRPNQIMPDGKIKSPRTGLIMYGDNEIDCTSTEQIISSSQTLGIAFVLQKLSRQSETAIIRETLNSIDKQLDLSGLDMLAPGQFHGMLTRPRMIEVAAALNRLRIPGAITQPK
jgi:predicted ABC-class ATPase